MHASGDARKQSFVENFAAFHRDLHLPDLFAARDSQQRAGAVRRGHRHYLSAQPFHVHRDRFQAIFHHAQERGSYREKNQRGSAVGVEREHCVAARCRPARFFIAVCPEQEYRLLSLDQRRRIRGSAGSMPAGQNFP
jgi:hypothetical protein